MWSSSKKVLRVSLNGTCVERGRIGVFLRNELESRIMRMICLLETMWRLEPSSCVMGRGFAAGQSLSSFTRKGSMAWCVIVFSLTLLKRT